MSDDNLSCNDENSGDEMLHRPLERWAPVGSANDGEDDVFSSSCTADAYSEAEKLRHLEEDQEQLNSSLLALTSHFAQVQFRLKQIVDASAEEKENLLKDLEEFAFRGIPDTRTYKISTSDSKNLSEEDHEVILQQQREKQKELIEQLKMQLEELERYAYETGEADMPQSMVMEKQKVIIDELKGKLPIDLDEFHSLSPEQLRKQVDRAISQLISPVKMKEQLVSQLKTQISDLERFIDFLQGEATSPGIYGMKQQKQCTCTCKMHSKHSGKDCEKSENWQTQKHENKWIREEEVNRRTINVVKRALTLMQMFIVTQFGCGIKSHFQQNLMKQTVGANHWGDLRARLEVAIATVVELASIQDQPVDSDYTSDSEEQVTVIQCNEKLTSGVRKHLALAIRDLLQHGLYRTGQSTSLVPFIGCLAVQSEVGPKKIHIWELIILYYELKNGKAYNATPARRLSQSFNLEIVGGQAITIKQTLLGVIDSILSSHGPFKRSNDSHFKAFICAGLNQKKLIPWLKLLLKTRFLVEQNYQPWSYVIKTGFEDAFISLERLNQFKFDLPVDLAVRSFQNIKDVF